MQVLFLFSLGFPVKIPAHSRLDRANFEYQCTVAMWSFVRKRKIGSGIALLLVVFAGWLWLMPARKPKIIGDIPPTEVAQIERYVRHEIWRGTFPTYSWSSIKHLPGIIHDRARVYIKSIRAVSETNDLHSRVLVVLGGTYPNSDSLTSQMFLQKTPKGWEELTILGDFDSLKPLNLIR